MGQSTRHANGMMERVVEVAPGSGAACPSARAALALLEQASALVGVVDDGAYGRASRVMPGGTMGKHFRHLVDHFAAALAGGGGAVIDYDHRERDVPMETDRGAALAQIGMLMERLRGIDGAAGAAAVRVRLMLSCDGEEHEFDSTLGRELAFAAHHAVHHHAMIGAIAAEMGVRTPEGFGRAPATLHHERGAGRRGSR